MTALQAFVSDHQALTYALFFISLFFDADIAFVFVAILVAQHALNWSFVLPIAFLGVFFGDLLWYGIGRSLKETPFGRWIHRRLAKYDAWVGENFLPRYKKIALFSKYLYGVNRLTPMIAGWHRMHLKDFIKIHLVSDLVWLLVLTLVGHSIGLAIWIIGPKKVVRRIEYFFLAVGVIFIGGEWVLKYLFEKRIARK